MFSGVTAGSGIRRALFAFSLSGIPAGSSVDSVSLQLRMSRTSSGPAPFGLHRLLADWGEGGSDAGNRAGGGAASAAGDATWIHTFYSTSFWASAGGDYVAAESASSTVDSIGYYTWGSTSGMVADVQSWTDAPAANYGWELLGDETNSGDAKRFDIRTNNTAAFFPKLTVTYTAAPEPGSLILLTGGSVLLLAQRRRRAT